MSSFPRWYAESAAALYGDLYNGGAFLSNRQAAPIIGKSKSTAAEFMRWFREHHAAYASGAPVAKPEGRKRRVRTWTDEDGNVVTDLGEYGLISFSESEMRAIRRDYSKHYGGKAASQSTLATRYGFATIAAFAIFKEVHELRQDGVPFDAVELEAESAEALADKAIAARRQQFFLTLAEKEREQERRDAEKWRTFEVSVQAILQNVQGSLSEVIVAPVRLQAADEPYAAVVGLTDEHFGRLALDHKGNEVYNLSIAASRYRAAVHDFARQLAKEGKPERIFLVAASDGCHFDNGYFTTERGTDQKAQSSGSYREVVSTYVRSVIEGVLHLSQIAPVEVIVVGGNHDRQTAAMVGMMLEFALEGRSDINVTNALHPRTYVAWGDNTFCFEHGDGVSPGKRQAEAARMFLVETAEQGVPLNRNRIVFAGDLHAEMLKDMGGVQYVVMPSLAKGSDSWHAQSRYVGTDAVPAMYLMRHKGGKAAIRYADPEALNLVV